MALVRCENCGNPRGRTRTYVRYVLPLGHPNSGLVCGTEDCQRPGFIWLESDEARAYERGERIFRLPTNVAKVQAQ